MKTLALLALLSLNACATYAGIAVAPNGAVWIAQNLEGFGPPMTYRIFVCTPQNGVLVCNRLPVREIP